MFGDIIVLAILLFVVAMSVRSLYKSKKKGGCCGNCSQCKGCHWKE